MACGAKKALGPLEPSGPVGRVRFVNVITDSRGAVNAILEGVLFGVSLAYTQSAPITLAARSTAPYESVLAGSRTFVLKRTADTTATVASLPFTSVANQDQTAYAVGGASGSAVTSLVTRDTNPVVSTGQARVRLVQLSPAAGAVDVFITAVGADLSAATPTIATVSFRGVSTYLLLAVGTYQIRAVPQEQLRQIAAQASRSISQAWRSRAAMPARSSQLTTLRVARRSAPSC